MRISGCALKFGTRGKPSFKEAIGRNCIDEFMPGCLDDWFKNPTQVRLTIGHNFGQHISSTAGGDLKIWANQCGLFFESEVSNSCGYDACKKIKTGVLTGCSWEGMAEDFHERRDDANGNLIRVVKKLQSCRKLL